MKLSPGAARAQEAGPWSGSECPPVHLPQLQGYRGTNRRQAGLGLNLHQLQSEEPPGASSLDSFYRWGN